MIFCNDLGAVPSGSSALCHGDHTFLSEEHLKEFANAYSISENDLKHEIPLAKKLLARTISFICSL